MKMKWKLNEKNENTNINENKTWKNNEKNENLGFGKMKKKW